MSGPKTGNEKLNYTLEAAVEILNKNNLNDWFIFFGTLLGIVRENSCIEGDDDIDFVIHNGECADWGGREQIFDVFESNGFEFIKDGWAYNKRSIQKTRPTKEFGSIDFYRSDVNENGDFYISWDRTWLRSAYKDKDLKSFVVKNWRSVPLQLPYRAKDRLSLMYGDWQVPHRGVKVKKGSDIS
jgi:phosphorylcholine metabolism protein LicD